MDLAVGLQRSGIVGVVRMPMIMRMPVSVVVMVMVIGVMVAVLMVMVIVMSVMVPVLMMVIVMSVMVPVLMVVMVMSMMAAVLMVVIMPMFMMMMVMIMLMMMSVLVMERFRGQLPFAKQRVRLPDDDAKDVRLRRQISRTGAVPDRFDDHRRDAAGKFVDEPGDNACTGRRRHLLLVWSRRDRQAAHHFQRGRRRHRIEAMVAVDRSGAKRNGRGDDFLDMQRVDRERHTDHIDDRIDRTHFVEMHLIHRDVVNFRFGYADFIENREGKRNRPFAKTRFMNQLDNFAVVAVMLRGIVRIRQHVHLERGNAAFIHPFPIEGKRFDRNFRQLRFDIIPVRARIDERGERHVSADAGKAVQV